MQDSVGLETLSDGITLALAAVREQHEKLLVLLDDARSASTARLVEQRRVREEAAAVAERIRELEAELAQRRSSELAHEVVALRERYRVLQQLDGRLNAQLEGLAVLSQRLLLASRESAIIAAMLTTEGTIQDSEEMLAGMFWQVAQAQEGERERLSREIHDGPAQALANAIFEIEFCERLLERDPVKLRKELARLKSDLRQSLGDVRHFIFGLRPAVLSELGLAATLRRYAEDYQARCGITFRLEIDEAVRLTGAQEVTIFRIVQEALQNTRKHSKASAVDVRLRVGASELEIVIEDNGQGFEVTQNAERRIGHFGLRGMQERARLIGGKLEIRSEPGGGTKVVLLVPREQRGGES